MTLPRHISWHLQAGKRTPILKVVLDQLVLPLRLSLVTDQWDKMKQHLEIPAGELMLEVARRRKSYGCNPRMAQRAVQVCVYHAHEQLRTKSMDGYMLQSPGDPHEVAFVLLPDAKD